LSRKLGDFTPDILTPILSVSFVKFITMKYKCLRQIKAKKKSNTIEYIIICVPYCSVHQNAQMKTVLPSKSVGRQLDRAAPKELIQIT